MKSYKREIRLGVLVIHIFDVKLYMYYRVQKSSLKKKFYFIQIEYRITFYLN